MSTLTWNPVSYNPDARLLALASNRPNPFETVTDIGDILTKYADRAPNTLALGESLVENLENQRKNRLKFEGDQFLREHPEILEQERLAGQDFKSYQDARQNVFSMPGMNPALFNEYFQKRLQDNLTIGENALNFESNRARQAAELDRSLLENKQLGRQDEEAAMLDLFKKTASPEIREQILKMHQDAPDDYNAIVNLLRQQKGYEKATVGTAQSVIQDILSGKVNAQELANQLAATEGAEKRLQIGLDNLGAAQFQGVFPTSVTLSALLGATDSNQWSSPLKALYGKEIFEADKPVQQAATNAVMHATSELLRKAGLSNVNDPRLNMMAAGFIVERLRKRSSNWFRDLVINHKNYTLDDQLEVSAMEDLQEKLKTSWNKWKGQEGRLVPVYGAGGLLDPTRIRSRITEAHQKASRAQGAFNTNIQEAIHNDIVAFGEAHPDLYSKTELDSLEKAVISAINPGSIVESYTPHAKDPEKEIPIEKDKRDWSTLPKEEQDNISARIAKMPKGKPRDEAEEAMRQARLTTMKTNPKTEIPTIVKSHLSPNNKSATTVELDNLQRVISENEKQLAKPTNSTETFWGSYDPDSGMILSPEEDAAEYRQHNAYVDQYIEPEIKSSVQSLLPKKGDPRSAVRKEYKKGKERLQQIQKILKKSGVPQNVLDRIQKEIDKLN